MRPLLCSREGKLRMLRSLQELGEAKAADIIPAVMPPYVNEATPRAWVQNLIVEGLAIIAHRDVRRGHTYCITTKGREFVQANQPEEV